MATYEEIKKHWDSLGESERDSHTASWNDSYMMQKEMTEISKYLIGTESVCDIGCNNGFCDFVLLHQFDKMTIFGIDYAENLIHQAIESLNKTGYKDRCAFSTGDVLDIGTYPNKKFDVVLLKRVLINLNSKEDQIQAISNVRRLLNDTGKVILTEAVLENWIKLNGLRREFGLEELKQSWHNKYLSSDVVKHFYDNFNVEVDSDYSSAYYIVSRVIHPWVKKLNGEKSWNYLSAINRLASMLPNFGDYGTQRLFVLSQKK